MLRDRFFLCVTALSLPFLTSMKGAKASPQETMQLRRIAENWKEGDYASAKKQILDLLTQNPDCASKEQLHVMLGDLYFFENNYQEALTSYAKIQESELQKKTRLNYLRSLFALNRFADLILVTESLVKEEQSIEIRYLLGESLWREGSKASDAQLKVAYFTKAKEEYCKLRGTKFNDASLLPLASIYRELKEYAEAASVYTELMDKYPAKKEEFLFQIASLKAHVNKEEACEAFGAVSKMGGKRAPAAAFNQLSILFQLKKYAEFITAEKSAHNFIVPEKKALIQFYTGKSYLAQKEYGQAVKPLQAYLSEKREATAEVKNALLSLLNCAKELKDLKLYENSLQELGELFPHDQDYAQALILHAGLCEQEGALDQAEAQIAQVAVKFPEMGNSESLLFERARLLGKTKKWQACREAFTTFLQSYPESAQIGAAWHQILNAALMERQNAKEEELVSKNTMLASLLQKATQLEGIWQQQEKENNNILLSKTLFALGKWDESATALRTFLKEFPNSSSIAEAHLMLALALHRANSEGEEFFEHAEKALTLDSNQENQAQIHLMLYNGYLKVHGENSENTTLLEKAADHLYACVMTGKAEIKRDNLLWLANYYYGRAKEEKGQIFSARAAQLFEQIVKNLKAISSATIDLEAETLKYADLLTFQGKNFEALAVLKQLKEVYEKNPALPWKFQRRGLLELGRAFTRVGENQKALSTYDFLINSSSYAASAAADVALLERARLEYGLLKQDEKSDANPRLVSILATLKDLEIKKKLMTEPVHLEAGLEYAEIKAELAPKEKRAERALSLLQNLKETFLNEENQESQEYQAGRLRLSEKDHLFQTYMKYIEALLLKTQASLCQKEEEAAELQAKAHLLLDELKASSGSLTPYLRERLEANKQL